MRGRHLSGSLINKRFKKPDNPASFFSVKEKQIIYEIFGIDILPSKSESVSLSDLYDVFRIMVKNYYNKLMNNQDEDQQHLRERKADN